MLRKSTFRELHYTEDLIFVSKEKDPIKKTFVFRNVRYTGATKDLFKMLCPDPETMEVDELRRIQLLKDLLDKMLVRVSAILGVPGARLILLLCHVILRPFFFLQVLDPTKRCSVKDALMHPFFSTK